MYSLKQITKNYVNGKQITEVLKGIDLDIAEGDFLAIMGSSGAGKTTLINILTMIEDYDEGEISFFAKSFRKYKDKERDQYRKKDISIIFQDYNLIQEMTVEENAYLGVLLAKSNAKELSFEEVVQQLNIKTLLNKYPDELSGGERQRVAIARSILNNSKCIFADEPTGALNKKNADILLEIFRKLNTDLEKTIVMVTHDPYVASYSNKFVYLKDGRIEKQLIKNDSQKKYYKEIISCLEEYDG